MPLKFPELVERVRLSVLKLPDLIGFRLVAIGSHKAAKLLFKGCDTVLVDPGLGPSMRLLAQSVLIVVDDRQDLSAPPRIKFALVLAKLSYSMDRRRAR